MVMEVVRLFEGLGAEVRLGSGAAGADAVVDVALDGSSVRFVVELKRRAPYVGEVPAMGAPFEKLEGAGVPLLVAPYISAALGDVLSNEGWSWVDFQGNADVRAPGLRVQRRVSSSPPKVEGEGLPSGSGSWAIVRSAISDGVVEGATAAAKHAGVSQPRASQVLERLTTAGYIEREGRSIWRVDRERLLDAFVEQYTGPGGSTSWFYSLDPPLTTANNAAESEEARSGGLAISGDVAADQLAPWRNPTHLTLYVTSPSIVKELDVVRAEGQGDGNVELIIPDDTSVFDADPTERLPLAHPTQVIWDLVRLGGADREEAAERVHAWLTSQ